MKTYVCDGKSQIFLDYYNNKFGIAIKDNVDDDGYQEKDKN